MDIYVKKNAGASAGGAFGKMRRGGDFQSLQDRAGLTIVPAMTRMQHHIAMDHGAEIGAGLSVRPRGLLLLTLR